MIRETTVDHRTLSLKSGKFATGQEQNKEWIESTLNNTKVNERKYFQTKNNFHPVFDKLDDPFCRLCPAIAMGCDVLLKGLHNFGPSKAFDITQQLDRLDCDDKKRKQVVKLILSHDQKQNVKNRKNIDATTLRCLVDSIVFEPTCDGYIYTSPKFLEEYLK